MRSFSRSRTSTGICSHCIPEMNWARPRVCAFFIPACSFDPDTGGAHDLLDPRELGPDVRAELLRRAANHFRAVGGQALRHVGLPERLDHHGVESINDR